MSRVRRGSPHSPYAATPNSSFSKSNSLCLSRSQPPLPERLPDESPANYLLRLEQILTKGQFASALGQSGDQFHQTVLRSYMRRYPFFGDPIDMSIRKLLMEAELPKEAQQIDRVLEGFAERYHECNPGIYSSADQAYFIAFSLLILHTDVFNKNNRRKMQKADYVRNTQADSIDEDVLGCFYDNIAYTPFIQIEDDTDPTVRTNPRKERRAMFSRKSTDNAPKISRPSKTPVDPYTLIIEKNLSVLRPNLKEILNFENPYSFVEQGDSVNTQRPRRPHNLPSVLQIMSLRSRPEAFNAMPSQIANSQGQPGLVELRVNKVGILWRKEPRMKKKARSPWQEWGALLTTSQLHLFKNPSWVRSLMHQQEQCARSPYSARSQFFSPPIEKLLADASYPIANTVALIDSSYKKHKNALTFTNHGSLEEVFLANDERDLQEWMCKLNHAAALSTVGLKQREELIGPGHDRSRALGAPRPISIDVSSSTGTGSETKHHDSIVRHSMLRSRIAELEEKVAIAHKQLDSQMQNARHVQLLTPILPRTRTQIISAAARVAAQIRWRRIEVCKLSCHREALSHELSVDPMLAAITKAELTETVEEDQEIVHAGNHSGSATDGITERSGHSLLRDTTAPDHETAHGGLRVASLNCPPASSQLLNDASSQPMQKNSRADVAQTQQDLVTDNSFHDDSLLKEPSKDSSLPRHVRASSKHSSIGSLSLSLQSTDVEATPSREHDLDGQTDDPPQSSVMEKRETRLLGESGSGRSLHRTLRDNKSPSRQRRQKARQSDASQSFVESLYDTDETTLPRTTGSFNVHGKKASVVTFGNDWQSTSAEERLRLRKQAAQLAEVG